MSAAAAPESPSDAASEAASEAASAAATEAACEEKLKCNRCGLKPLSEFANNPKGVPYKICKPCRPIVAAIKKKHKETEKFKATTKAYKDGDNGKAATKRYKDGDAFKAATKRYKDGDAFKAATKRYLDGDAFKEAIRRRTAKESERRATDPAWRLMKNTHLLAHHVFTGIIENSPTFLTRTGWVSDAFHSHVLASVPPGSGFTMANYGQTGVWDIDHRIPQEAYNFDDPNDILRCWNPRNVRGISRFENRGKGIKLLDDQMAYVGADCFPASWHGEVPTEEERQAFYKRVKIRQEAYDEEDDESDDESESD